MHLSLSCFKSSLKFFLKESGDDDARARLDLAEVSECNANVFSVNEVGEDNE